MEKIIFKRYGGKGINHFLIDDLELFLQSLTGIPVRAITMCP